LKVIKWSVNAKNCHICVMFCIFNFLTTVKENNTGLSLCYNRKPQIRFNLYFLELYCILFVYNYCIVVFLFHGENKWKTFRFKHFIRKLEKIFYLRKKLWKDFDDSFHFVTTCRWRYWTKSNRNGKPIKDLKNKIIKIINKGKWNKV
jgi:hypothetical protein